MPLYILGVRRPADRAWLQLLAGIAGLVVLAVALPAPWTAAPPTAGRSVGRGIGPAADAVGAAMLLVASVLVWLLLLWALVAAGAALSSRLPGTVGRGGRRVLARVAPAAARRVLLAAVGASMVTGLAGCATGPASTDQAGPGTPVAGIAADAQVDVTLAGGRTVIARQAASWIAVEGSAVHLRAAGRAVSPAPAASLDVDWPTVLPAPGAAPVVVEGDGSRATGDGRSGGPVDIDWPAGRATTAGSVVVLRGDSLWSIAARHLPPEATPDDIDRAWHQWYAANEGVIGTDPDLILPGQILLPPNTGTGH